MRRTAPTEAAGRVRSKPVIRKHHQQDPGPDQAGEERSMSCSPVTHIIHTYIYTHNISMEGKKTTKQKARLFQPISKPNKQTHSTHSFPPAATSTTHIQAKATLLALALFLLPPRSQLLFCLGSGDGRTKTTKQNKAKNDKTKTKPNQTKPNERRVNS